MLNFERFVNEAKASRGPKLSNEDSMRLIELGLIDLDSYIDQWKWNPEALMMYIKSLPNPENCDIEQHRNEIIIKFGKPDGVHKRFANYHLIEDGGAVFGYIENSVYDEDDAMDPYGSNDDPNSLSIKIKRFMEWPSEYTRSFQ